MTSRIYAFPEFQTYSEKHSGRPGNCGMCHAHPDGPSGSEARQLGSLTPEEMERVNLSRAALEPGQEIDSPILNAFGNHIIKAVGAKKVVDAQKDPAELATALGNTSDLDGDGIADAREFLDGTDPLDRNHGDPGKLLLINLQRHWGQVLFIVVTLSLILLGLTGVLKTLRNRDGDTPE
ncbi:MAG: thrombospondin type 3 repeat-containing protein [Armatimonadota bacterium]